MIVRDWHDILRYQVTDEGGCRYCGAALPGRYARYDGAWGRRRVPVRVARIRALATDYATNPSASFIRCTLPEGPFGRSGTNRT